MGTRVSGRPHATSQQRLKDGSGVVQTEVNTISKKEEKKKLNRVGKSTQRLPNSQRNDVLLCEGEHGLVGLKRAVKHVVTVADLPPPDPVLRRHCLWLLKKL